MITKNLKDFFKGWFVGNFEPSMLKTDDFEIGIKRYNKGDVEESHYHKEAIEYTVVIEGIVKMNDIIYKKDDIIEVQKMETISFECLEDAVTVVIKTPCVKGDKYLA
jgi:hypothetical protein